MPTKNRLFLEYILVALALIALNFTPLKLVGILLPIAYLILDKRIRKRTRQELGVNIKATPCDLKQNWHLILLVAAVLPIAFTLIGKFFVPEYFSHLMQRVSPYVKIDTQNLDKVFLQLLFLAFGEEIAFRAFLQGRLSMFISPALSVFIASAAFAGVHYSPGAPVVVGIDLVSVFADSLVFGFLYKRTKNVYLTTIAHFLGNSVGIVILICMRS
jgi:uncharacterized protein